MHELVGGETSSAKLGNLSSILGMISDEIADEMNDILISSDDAKIETYWAWVSQIIAWIGHGDISALPEELQPFARRIDGIMEPIPQLAIESA